MLTLHGYRIPKVKIENLNDLKGRLMIRPYVPSVFTKYVPRYPAYQESAEYMYVPKHFGISEFGIPESMRNVPQTPDEYWKFTGTLRDIQHTVVNSFLKPEPHDGILSLQTGGGKTVCALYIASQLKLPTLVLVHNTFLRDQWVERIKAFLPNARIGKVQGDIINIQDITVGMLQTISMKELPKDTFKTIGLVIVDECHHIASEAFSQAIPKLTSKYMLGLSATPERKDKLMYVINWFLGPLLYKSDNTDQEDDQVQVQYLEFEPEDKEFNEVIYNDAGVMFTSLMINKVVEYEPRNKVLATLIEDIYHEKRNLLVLTDRVEHTKTLFELLSKEVKEVSCILSRTLNQKQREEYFKEKQIFIATYQLCKEGFDLEKLNTLLMATPRPDVIQIVGRILRTHKSQRKIHPLILDVVDPAFRRQFQERLQLYRKRNYSIAKIEV